MNAYKPKATVQNLSSNRVGAAVGRMLGRGTAVCCLFSISRSAFLQWENLSLYFKERVGQELSQKQAPLE